MQGDCPNCGKGTQTYFGDIFIVQGPRESNTVTCEKCKSKMEFNALKRWVVPSLFKLPSIAVHRCCQLLPLLLLTRQPCADCHQEC